MRLTAPEVMEMKGKEKIVMLTAYDFPTAKLAEEAGVHIILVGDSLGMVVLGYETTIPVTMDEMIHHTKAVSRATKKALIVGDMPFMSYASISDALRNSARFIQEGGAQAVKLEGGEVMAETIRKIVDCGIPVMAHIGLTPQSIYQLGGFRVRGKTLETARQLLKDAEAVSQAGAFAVVLESIPYLLAKLITERIPIPTIGIGAGPFCDGQVQVISDIIGSYTEFIPRHAKRYANISQIIKEALNQYVKEVKEGIFPTEAHSYKLDPEILEELEKG